MFCFRKKTKKTPTSVVKLDVGGVRVVTRVETLTKFPDSRLAKSFLATKTNSNSSGEVFAIDINPEYFSVILDWLR